jgi:hypothetical protein
MADAILGFTQSDEVPAPPPLRAGFAIYEKLNSNAP